MQNCCQILQPVATQKRHMCPFHLTIFFTFFLQDKITRENGRNKSTEDEINDLKKQIAILTQQVIMTIITQSFYE